jgi:uncharacterized protein GlcG (DUF336 family)
MVAASLRQKKVLWGRNAGVYDEFLLSFSFLKYMAQMAQNGTVRMEDTFTRRHLALKKAEEIKQRAVEAAKIRGVLVDVCICTRDGLIKVFVSMDNNSDEGAPERSEGLAHPKARTSAMTGKRTEVLAGLAQPGQVLFSIEKSDPKFTLVAGGIPITLDDGSVVGGIGVSGGRPMEDDVVIAEYALGLRNSASE